jgi:hypothetical protein
MKWRFGLFGCLLSLLLSGILMSACRKEAIAPDKPAQPPSPDTLIVQRFIDIDPDQHYNISASFGGALEVLFDVDEDSLTDIVFQLSRTIWHNGSYGGSQAETFSSWQVQAAKEGAVFYAMVHDSSFIPRKDTLEWYAGTIGLYSFSNVYIPPPGSSSSAGYWKSQSHKHLLLRKVTGKDTLYSSILMSTGSNPSLTLEAFSYQQIVIQE